MVRAPCCEKMGLKKGPWTPEEDQILISYIQKNGHGNWRALPKQAGLLRCGKSCRLRWTNYLRPDIKRGNFTKEEEDTIINLHEMLGNRWSAIAARLPGRTDNEIKNVWHTHLKKKLKDYNPPNRTKSQSSSQSVNKSDVSETESSNVTNIQHVVTSHARTLSPLPGRGHGCNDSDAIDIQQVVTSPTRSSSEMSSVTDTVVKQEDYESSEYFPQIDESFWTEDITGFSWETSVSLENCNENVDMTYCHSTTDDMDFWYNVFVRAGDLPELPEF